MPKWWSGEFSLPSSEGRGKFRRPKRSSDYSNARGRKCNFIRRSQGCLFRDGTIEVDLAGQPAAGADAGVRGFIGIAFRLQGDGRYEYIYLRPTNGRADDQIRRNHSTQYSSYPNFDFDRSRKEAPEKYESYVDLQPGVWIRYKIQVEGNKARLYVDGAEQPCLIVNDLKLEPKAGNVALWVGPEPRAIFRI